AYAQTGYDFAPQLSTLLAVRYEAERGFSAFTSPAFSGGNSVSRNNKDLLLEAHGGLHSRLFYTVGGSVERNTVFGTEATPRVGLAFYPFTGNSGVWRDTKLKFNFGKGIKEPSIFEETSSLFAFLK